MQSHDYYDTGLAATIAGSFFSMWLFFRMLDHGVKEVEQFATFSLIAAVIFSNNSLLWLSTQ